MTDLPLHPALVHLPLGLAVIVPLLTLAVLVAAWRDLLPRRAAWLLVLVQGAVLAGALLSLRTGEAEEERVEAVVSEAAIHDHEELAEAFTAASGGVLVLVLLGAALPWRKASLAALGTATVASAGSLALGIAVGHAGGELVYRHGAAQVGAPTASLGTVLSGGEGEEGEEEDDD